MPASAGTYKEWLDRNEAYFGLRRPPYPMTSAQWRSSFLDLIHRHGAGMIDPEAFEVARAWHQERAEDHVETGWAVPKVPVR